MMKFQSGCLICGKDLVYLPQMEPQTCFYCGRTTESDARCEQGHFVCDACHAADGDDLIETYCLKAGGTDPVEMANILMSHSSIAMHGPEHHFLVPAVLLAAYYNKYPGDEREAKIRQARVRAGGVRGGSCGLCGNCGAAVGTGIFVSLILGATPLSTQEWRLSNRMTAESLMAVAEHGGPRCCKRDTYLSLQSAQAFVQDHFGWVFDIQEPIHCNFHSFNKECLQSDCPFFS